jgi:YfiH family protein
MDNNLRAGYSGDGSLYMNSKNGVSFFQFENLRGFPNVRHGIFTRHFGFSKAPFQSMNVTHGLGDDDADVAKNRQRIAACLGGGDLVFVQQVHAADVLTIRHNSVWRQKNAGDGLLSGDAVVTALPDTHLVIQVADCQSVMLYDPLQHVVANVHSGWRGSIENIIGHTVMVMEREFDCHAKNMFAGIGPSLGPCCAEFINYKDEIPAAFWDYKDNFHHFDFWAISRDQLAAAGIPAEHINSSDICTKCNTDTFFSYRGEGITGRFASVIGLV